MKFTEIIKILFIVTVVSITYIHMQMVIVQHAYLAKKREKEIRALVDKNGQITYHILHLESANHLGIQMLNEESDMQFFDNRDVVKFEVPGLLLNEQKQRNELALSREPHKSLRSWLQFFSSIPAAEARSK